MNLPNETENSSKVTKFGDTGVKSDLMTVLAISLHPRRQNYPVLHDLDVVMD